MVIDVTHLFQIPLMWPRERLQVGRVTGIAIHHEAVLWLRPNATVEEEINHLRAIDRYHREVKGFGGFAYHMAAFPTGRIYLVTSLIQMGAHVYQKNDRLYGIMLAGLFSVTVPGEKQLDATSEGIKYLDNFLGRQVEVGPHRKWTDTSCPGDVWEQWVPQLRKEDTMTPEERALLLTLQGQVNQLIEAHQDGGNDHHHVLRIIQAQLNQMIESHQGAHGQGAGGVSLEEIVEELVIEGNLRVK